MCLGEGSNHSRVCPCLKKAYFEINHFRTPCSPHGEVARIPYHDHNSTTAEQTELKYLYLHMDLFLYTKMEGEAFSTSNPLLLHYQPLYVTSRYKDLCYTWQHSPAPWHVVTWAVWPAASGERRVRCSQNSKQTIQEAAFLVLAAVLGLLKIKSNSKYTI